MINCALRALKALLQLPKDIYLTVFTVFFRAGSAGWPTGINAGKGVAGAALVQSAFLLGMACWIDILTGRKLLAELPRWADVLLFLLLCAANHYILVLRRHGTEFERRFSELQKPRKIVLMAGFGVVILAAILFFVYSASIHRKAIGLL